MSLQPRLALVWREERYLVELGILVLVQMKLVLLQMVLQSLVIVKDPSDVQITSHYPSPSPTV